MEMRARGKLKEDVMGLMVGSAKERERERLKQIFSVPETQAVLYTQLG
jgi:hypothetical protein